MAGAAKRNDSTPLHPVRTAARWSGWWEQESTRRHSPSKQPCARLSSSDRRPITCHAPSGKHHTRGKEQPSATRLGACESSRHTAACCDQLGQCSGGSASLTGQRLVTAARVRLQGLHKAARVAVAIEFSDACRQPSVVSSAHWFVQATRMGGPACRAQDAPAAGAPMARSSSHGRPWPNGVHHATSACGLHHVT